MNVKIIVAIVLLLVAGAFGFTSFRASMTPYISFAEARRATGMVQVNGVLGKEGPFAPPPIAEAMWQAVSRSDDEWTPHVSYDG